MDRVPCGVDLGNGRGGSFSMTALFLALVGGAGAVVAYLLTRPKRKEKAPAATAWIGPIGLTNWAGKRVFPLQLDPVEIVSIVASIEEFLWGEDLGKKLSPVVVVFVEGLIPIEGGRTAAGVHHPEKLWTHSWIELSLGGGGWFPKTLRETAFEHELLHHATGMPDSKEFRALFARYREAHPV